MDEWKVGRAQLCGQANKQRAAQGKATGFLNINVTYEDKTKDQNVWGASLGVFVLIFGLFLANFHFKWVRRMNNKIVLSAENK